MLATNNNHYLIASSLRFLISAPFEHNSWHSNGTLDRFVRVSRAHYKLDLASYTEAGPNQEVLTAGHAWTGSRKLLMKPFIIVMALKRAHVSISSGPAHKKPQEAHKPIAGHQRQTATSKSGPLVRPHSHAANSNLCSGRRRKQRTISAINEFTHFYIRKRGQHLHTCHYFHLLWQSSLYMRENEAQRFSSGELRGA